ncbi:hypothetical protein Sjap_014875 [Stephania japonica]|uniref:Uncharacterized protein n=1 Tax=Stephania japonica TaxID=461633 RepID=A0AAP0NQV4_9MAGN
MDPVSYGRAKANHVSSGVRPIVEAHLGLTLSRELFKRLPDESRLHDYAKAKTKDKIMTQPE